MLHSGLCRLQRRRAGACALWRCRARTASVTSVLRVPSFLRVHLCAVCCVLGHVASGYTCVLGDVAAVSDGEEGECRNAPEAWEGHLWSFECRAMRNDPGVTAPVLWCCVVDAFTYDCGLTVWGVL